MSTSPTEERPDVTPEIPSGFVREDVSPYAYFQEQMASVRTKDAWVVIGLRVVFVGFFLAILIVQSNAVFDITKTALSSAHIVEIQPILSVIIGGTLTETYYILKLMVQFVFRDIDYKQ